jgi:Family of unknown function (DUF6011)
MDLTGQLTDAVNAKRFIFAGNAYFTVRSVKTGVRYTFRVIANKGLQTPAYFVYFLTGPDNTSDYTYLGIIRTGRFFLTKASTMTEDSTPVKAFRWVFDHIQKECFPPKTEVWHDGRCGRCGRKLTVPESVGAGIGPECAGRMAA